MVKLLSQGNLLGRVGRLRPAQGAGMPCLSFKDEGEEGRGVRLDLEDSAKWRELTVWRQMGLVHT